MDSGAYGTLVVTHSITIDGGGNFASSLVGFYTGIQINITANDGLGNTVIIRGLQFDSDGDWGYGVWVTGTIATHVHLEDVTFHRPGTAVMMAPGAAGSSLRMENVWVSKPITDGFVMSPPSSGAALKMSLNNVRVSQAGGVGLRLKWNTEGVVSNSFFQNNGNGVTIEQSSVHVSLVRTILSSNTQNGLLHSASGTTTVLDGCSIMGNSVGVSNTGSTVIGFGNNAIAYNITDVSGNAIQTLVPQ
jgi:hypothetical protein